MIGEAMKKKLITLLLVLLSLCLIAAAVNVGKRASSGGFISSGNSTGGSNNENGSGDDTSGEGTSPEELSWIDPALGIDIFDYDNILNFTEGEKLDVSPISGEFPEIFAVTYADESIDIPSEKISALDNYMVSLGSITLQAHYDYYFYYARELDGEYERCGLGYEDMEDGVYDIDFRFSGPGEVTEFGRFQAYESGSISLNLVQGLSGTSPNVQTGKFYLRVIAVPQ